MHDRLHFITHQGKKILVIDFSGCSAAQMMPLLDDIEVAVARSPKDSLLTLADFADAQINKAVATKIKEVLTRDRPYVRRSAWVHTEKLPKVFYEAFKTFSKREFPIFKNREEAMDWLVGEQ
jgi:predicted proteasome-type protease